MFSGKEVFFFSLFYIRILRFKIIQKFLSKPSMIRSITVYFIRCRHCLVRYICASQFQYKSQKSTQFSQKSNKNRANFRNNFFNINIFQQTRKARTQKLWAILRCLQICLQIELFWHSKYSYNQKNPYLNIFELSKGQFYTLIRFSCFFIFITWHYQNPSNPYPRTIAHGIRYCLDR